MKTTLQINSIIEQYLSYVGWPPLPFPSNSTGQLGLSVSESDSAMLAFQGRNPAAI